MTTTAEKLVALGMAPELALAIVDNILDLTAVLEPITVGVDGTGHDVLFYSATAGKKFLWDESADKLIILGDFDLTGTQTITGSITGVTGITGAAANRVAGFYPTAVQQAINANGAINLTSYSTAITSVGTTGVTFTLADSTVTGQRKRIQMIVDDGDATVTFNTNATIVFADVGDVAELIWNGSDWIPIALFNCADGATAPVYTAAS
jgi:hypothetical protein